MTEVDHSDLALTDVCEMLPINISEPVIMRRRAQARQLVEFLVGRQRAPDKPKAEWNHDVGETGLPETSGAAVVRGQNETFHRGSPFCGPRYGFTSVGCQRHIRSLVRCVPPHQRSIGLWRLKSSSCRRTDLPKSVIERRLRR